MSLKNKEVYIVVIVLILSMLAFPIQVIGKENESSKQIIYFYSTTCSSCYEVQKFLDSIEDIDLIIKKYNISEADNKGILNTYCEYYNVQKDEYGLVPIIFVSDQYLFGAEDILNRLEIVLEEEYIEETSIFSTADYTHDVSKFETLNIGTVMMFGLVNGFNPCSLAILIFLLTLLSGKGNDILKYGFAFIFGKFISFFLLGVLLFNVLSDINLSFISAITKYVFAFICILFIILNLYDFINLNKQKHEKVKLKLPNKVISFNQKLIKRVSKRKNSYFDEVIYIVLGILISCSEFLCTGQIYLTTIVTMINQEVYITQATFYLLLFDLAAVLPLIFYVLIIYKLKSTYEISNHLVKNMKYIKLVNAIIFLIILVIYVK